MMRSKARQLRVRRDAAGNDVALAKASNLSTIDVALARRLSRIVLFWVAAVMLAGGSSWAAQTVPVTSKLDVHKSVVRITATSQDPDYKAPWNPGNVSEAIGAGFIIDGQRIMTNAHVVSNARFLALEKENDPKPYEATVEYVGHDCDLAVIKVADPKFFKGTVPLQFGSLPSVQSSVDVFGYPVGGQRMSVTHGIVSRVDYQTYSHSGVDLHLVVQIDAAINPGNSGGPVLQDGKVVGVAFQGYSGDVAQNVGYMIPTPVTNRFLRDIASGHYDRYVDLSITTFKLTNPAERAALGLPDDNSGVLVSSVATGGSCDGKLKVGDVILSLDGHPVASDGSVLVDGENVDLAEIVERKLKDEQVDLGIFRGKQKLNVQVKLEPNDPYLMQASRYDVYPRFILFGGLVFQPLSRNFMDAYQPNDLRLRYFYDFFVTDEIYTEHPEVVVLANILNDPVNAYLGEFRYQIVDQINGVKIQTLDDAAKALGKPADNYVIKFIGSNRPAVLNREAVEAAQNRIRTNYNIPIEENLTGAGF